MQISNSANIFVFTWKQYVEDFTLKHRLIFEICAREICEKFVYKHTQTKRICSKLFYFLRNFQTSRVNNSRILRIKKDFQICISVPLRDQNVTVSNKIEKIMKLSCFYKINLQGVPSIEGVGMDWLLSFSFFEKIYCIFLCQICIVF